MNSCTGLQHRSVNAFNGVTGAYAWLITLSDQVVERLLLLCALHQLYWSRAWCAGRREGIQGYIETLLDCASSWFGDDFSETLVWLRQYERVSPCLTQRDFCVSCRFIFCSTDWCLYSDHNMHLKSTNVPCTVFTSSCFVVFFNSM